MIRIAAIGDLHIRWDLPEQVGEELAQLHHRADLLIVPGDITNHGTLRQAEIAADLFRRTRLPIYAVLGNHDRRSTRRRTFCRLLATGGVTVLDGQAAVIDIRGTRIGVAGVGGSGGGFWPVEGPDTLSRKAFQVLAVRARREAARLDRALASLHTDLTVVVTHFAPTASTLGQEPLVKYPLLGNIELARVIDRYPVDLVLHGHAHHGNPIGHTPGGTLVRNVALDVIGRPIVHNLSARPALPQRDHQFLIAKGPA
jgi:Icc-related predicted phosphoesterase